MKINRPLSFKKLEKTILQIGKAIRNESVEYGAVVNPDTGILQLCKKGKEYEVPLSKKERASLKNMIFIHNHPEESPVSRSDVAEAFICKLNQLVVITKKYCYFIKIPDKFSSRALPKEFVNEVNQTYERFLSSKKSIQRISFISKYIHYCRIEESNLERELSKSGKEHTISEYWDNVWKRFAEGIPGFEYKKKKL